MSIAFALICWLSSVGMLTLAGYWGMAALDTGELIYVAALIVCAGIAAGGATMACRFFFEGL